MKLSAVRSLILASLLMPTLMAAQTANTAIPTQHNEATVAQLQAEMASGQLTSEQLTNEYIARIVALDQNGPGVNAVIELNPDALAMARNADELRRHDTELGPLQCCSRTTLIPATRCRPARAYLRWSAHPRSAIPRLPPTCALVAR